MRRVSIVGLEFVAAVLAMACGGGTSNHSTSTPEVRDQLGGNSPTSTSAVMTVSATPTSLPAPTPLVVGPDVRHCAASDLTTSVHDNGGGMHIWQFFLLANRSDTPCQISLMPQVQFVDASGALVPIEARCLNSECRIQLPVLLLAHGTFLRNGGQVPPGLAALTLNWLEAVACLTPPPVASARVRLVLDGGDYLPLNASVGPCGGVEILLFGPSGMR